MELGTLLKSSERYRFGALAFLTPASAESGYYPSLRADSVFLITENLRTNFHSFKYPNHACVQKGVLRAQAFIQKGRLLTKSLRDTFRRSIKFLVLLVEVHALRNSTVSAEKVSKLALFEIRKAASRGDHLSDCSGIRSCHCTESKTNKVSNDIRLWTCECGDESDCVADAAHRFESIRHGWKYLLLVYRSSEWLLAIASPRR